MNLLYVCDSDRGGIAHYAQHQLRALAEQDMRVTLLCRPTFPETPSNISRLDLLPGFPARSSFKLLRYGRYLRDARAQARVVVEQAWKQQAEAVLFACYREYFAPLWFGPLLREARRSTVFATIAHDPVRDFIAGPAWWHRWSVRCGYAFIRHVFVHDETPVDFGGPPPQGIQVHIIPHGPFSLPPSATDRNEVRRLHGLANDDHVFLAFGQIRDGKNLDLFLQAMTQLPENVKLLVTGSGGATSQKPPAFYQTLAARLGLAHRCRWVIRHIPDSEIAGLFAACDSVLLAYSATFRSASGVLNTAVTCRRPVLASSGSGPLKTSVEKFRLGIWTAPDDAEAMRAAAMQLIDSPPRPNWEGYEAEHAWSRNAALILQALGDTSS